MNIEDQYVIEDEQPFFGGDNDKGIKSIFLNQYGRCCLEGSKEMIKGGNVTKIINGKPVTIQVPNQREIFINTVKIMEIILKPKFDKETEAKMGLLDNDIKNKNNEAEKDYEAKQQAYELKKRNPKVQLPAWANIENQIYDELQLKLVKVYQKKLLVLSTLLNKLNYFEEGSI